LSERQPLDPGILAVGPGKRVKRIRIGRDGKRPHERFIGWKPAARPPQSVMPGPHAQAGRADAHRQALVVLQLASGVPGDGVVHAGVDEVQRATVAFRVVLVEEHIIVGARDLDR
jgi:hypothetical protein